MGPWQFFASYFRVDNPFLWAHAAIGVLCVLLFVRLSSIADATTKVLDTAGDLSESELRSFTFPSDTILGYLESCGAGFVLVGLIGTMYGFVGALPKLHQAQYDFRDFAEALSTSAFGICWSVVLTLSASLFKSNRLDPITQLLYKGVKAQKLAEILARTVVQFGDTVTRDLREGTAKFASVTTELAQAARSLGNVTEETAASFGAGMDRTIKSAEKLNALVAQLSELPSSIGRQVEDTFKTISETTAQQSLRFQEEQEKRTRTAALGFGKALADALAKLDGLPDQMRDAVAAQSRVYGEAFDSLSRAAIDQLTAHVSGLRHGANQAVEHEMLVYQKAVDKMIRAATSGLQEGLDNLIATTSTLSQTISRTVDASNKQLTDTLGGRTLVSEPARTPIPTGGNRQAPRRMSWHSVGGAGHDEDATAANQGRTTQTIDLPERGMSNPSNERLTAAQAHEPKQPTEGHQVRHPMPVDNSSGLGERNGADMNLPPAMGNTVIPLNRHVGGDLGRTAPTADQRRQSRETGDHLPPQNAIIPSTASPTEDLYEPGPDKHGTVVAGDAESASTVTSFASTRESPLLQPSSYPSGSELFIEPTSVLQSSRLALKKALRRLLGWRKPAADSELL